MIIWKSWDLVGEIPSWNPYQHIIPLPFPNPLKYCWWTKSCTSWYGKYPIIYRVFYIPGGCLGFLPSTVGSPKHVTILVVIATRKGSTKAMDPQQRLLQLGLKRWISWLCTSSILGVANILLVILDYIMFHICIYLVNEFYAPFRYLFRYVISESM